MPKLGILRIGVSCATLLVVCGSAGFAASESESPLAEGPHPLAPHELGIGRLISDLEIRPITGKAFRLSHLKSKSPIVIAFTSTSCPVANRYAPTLAAI